MEPVSPEERLTKIENAIHSLIGQSRHEAEIEKQNAGIRDLVVRSRAFLDSQQEVTRQIEKLREAQQGTDEKLHALIDTVDRIIRQQNL